MSPCMFSVINVYMFTFTKDPSCKLSDQCNLVGFGYAPPHQHILLTINAKEMSCALLGFILKKKRIESHYVNCIHLLPFCDFSW